jgi:hypothetical protein
LAAQIFGDSDWSMAGIRAEILGSAIMIGHRAYAMTQRSSTSFLIGCSVRFGDSDWWMKFSSPGLGPRCAEAFHVQNMTSSTVTYE